MSMAATYARGYMPACRLGTWRGASHFERKASRSAQAARHRDALISMRVIIAYAAIRCERRAAAARGRAPTLTTATGARNDGRVILRLGLFADRRRLRRPPVSGSRPFAARRRAASASMRLDVALPERRDEEEDRRGATGSKFPPHHRCAARVRRLAILHFLI